MLRHMLLGLRTWVIGHPVLTALVVTIPLLLVPAWVTWRNIAGAAAEKFQVQWSPYCSPGVLTEVDGASEMDPPVSAIRSKAGWQCEIELDIWNGSDRTVHVSRIEASHLGSGGRSEIVGFSTADATIRDAGPPEHQGEIGHVDAAYDVDLELSAQEHATVRLKVGWRADGCNSAGRFTLTGWPVVVFEILGRTFDHRPDQDLILLTYDDSHDIQHDEPGRRCGFPLTARRATTEEQ